MKFSITIQQKNKKKEKNNVTNHFFFFKIKFFYFFQGIRIRTVSPSSEEEASGKKRVFPNDMPSAIKMFYRNTNVHVFTFSNPFRKSNAPPQNEFRELWIRSTYVFTKDVFPTLFRYSPVVHTLTVN